MKNRKKTKREVNSFISTFLSAVISGKGLFCYEAGGDGGAVLRVSNIEGSEGILNGGRFRTEF